MSRVLETDCVLVPATKVLGNMTGNEKGNVKHCRGDTFLVQELRGSS